MKTVGWIATILFIFAFLYICSGVDTYVDKNMSYMVIYEVECGSCDIHYTNETGGMSVADNMKTWREVMFVKGGTFVSLSAQNNRTTGKVSAKIRISDNVLDLEECEGSYCIASPSGRVKDLKNL